jgi:poly-gamma-glutamate synthesis protein (capsule biosynthesis protein)
MIARITLGGTEQTVEVVPLNVLNREVRFRPAVLTGERGDEVIARLNLLSQPFNTRLVSSGGRNLLSDTPQTASAQQWTTGEMSRGEPAPANFRGNFR